jgi:hypothetical protein
VDTSPWSRTSTNLNFGFQPPNYTAQQTIKPRILFSAVKTSNYISIFYEIDITLWSIKLLVGIETVVTDVSINSWTAKIILMCMIQLWYFVVSCWMLVTMFSVTIPVKGEGLGKCDHRRFKVTNFWVGTQGKEGQTQDSSEAKNRTYGRKKILRC